MLSEDEVRSKVRAIVMSYLSIHPDKPFEEEAELEKDYGMDEVDVIEVALAIEEELGIQMNDNALCGALTTAQLMDLVVKTVEEQL